MSASERRMAPRHVVGYLERVLRAYACLNGCRPDPDIILYLESMHYESC